MSQPMTKDEFLQLKQQGYSHVPLIKKRLMDDATPVAVFANIRKLNPKAYLFESVVGGERFARYSMIGLGKGVYFEYQDGTMRVGSELVGTVSSQKTDKPFDEIRRFMQQFRMPSATEIVDLPVFSGGLVGYFGHDLIRTIEPSVGQSDAPNPLNLPDLWLMLSTEVVVFDNLEHTLSIVVYANCDVENGYEDALQRLQAIEQAVAQKADLSTATRAKPEFVSQTGKEKYCEDVKKIKEYILAGDVMQVVPAQRLSADFDGDALSVYRALRYLNPSPYLFIVHGETFGTDKSPFDIIGASPEILSRIEDGMVTVRPLAGTRRRGQDAAEDLALEQELLADQKEIAEHLMLIDLARNDIGRVCQVGSVQVTDKMFIERYSQVMHIASNVEGVVRDDVDALDVFCATFPAGTLSGAPKIRAMQIIDEVEPVRRTVFGGAVGYVGWHGNMDTAIAIRTAVMKDGKVHVQAGAGVVADSDPVAEWEETNKKALALVKAVELACDGLNI
ncbi:anthranilate synthase component 1 [Moraxella cuniculi DSM 21768]|uniref:Anthranilate synthase component 1 n=2 Tax=Moraxella cuniculi TaxID=34061 RepID=A0A1N7E4B7_9GAMM|nr:anthranilate synthase component I [Moraxella cuniculi]OOS02779.1 anthranilate synthase component I [Moraxella cuniculi]SIR82923.1 anthranilate synthase component 1 [Moraxella cuniculi DSM 21768]